MSSSSDEEEEDVGAPSSTVLDHSDDKEGEEDSADKVAARDMAGLQLS